MQAVADLGATLLVADGEYCATADEPVAGGLADRPHQQPVLAPLAQDVGDLALGLRQLGPRRVAPVAHHLPITVDGEKCRGIVHAEFTQAQPVGMQFGLLEMTVHRVAPWFARAGAAGENAGFHRPAELILPCPSFA
ncbi:hypothetical protein [Stenotrophomonas sp. Marseille-Q4652]|uniref:hypothetical protein n=1 Tax=Stenotrophomonas sp. Marseille-Q4652 TaxID=2866595 RepID=UPI0021F17627|nr:hypothetical protein [Stenotrophomonas sp. Marseille-Q4652]